MSKRTKKYELSEFIQFVIYMVQHKPKRKHTRLIILKALKKTLYINYILICLFQSKANYTDQNYKCNTFVFAPIFHELNSKI